MLPLNVLWYETLTPNSFEIVVHNTALLTLKIDGTIVLLFLRSVLLKIIPVFGSAGNTFHKKHSFHYVGQYPLKKMILLLFFDLRLTQLSYKIFSRNVKKQEILQENTSLFKKMKKSFKKTGLFF